jgi:hypothetical protein
LGRIRRAILEIFAGAVLSIAIFFLMLSVILGAFSNYFAFAAPTYLWVVGFYVPYLVVGLVSYLNEWKVLGLTLFVVGFIAVIALAGFVYGLGATLPR